MLAGGIAHDFNNLLGGIFGYIDLAVTEIENPEVIEYLNNALNAIDRAKDLTRQLLTFAKGDEPVKKACMIFPYLNKVIDLR
jgi:signal transduction histidine kinase